MKERSQLFLGLGIGLMIAGSLLLLGHIRLCLMPFVLVWASIGAWIHLRNKKYLAAIALFMLFAGAGMNSAVLATNDWKMPTFTTDRKTIEEIYRENTHTVAGEKTKFKLLCDQEMLRGFSPGDLTGITGVLLFYYAYFKKKRAASPTLVTGNEAGVS